MRTLGQTLSPLSFVDEERTPYCKNATRANLSQTPVFAPRASAKQLIRLVYSTS